MFEIKTDFRRHVPHLLSLAAVLLAGVGGWVAFPYDRGFQMVMAVGLPVAYFIWGVIHHAIHEDLYWRVVVEYAVVAAIGATLMITVVRWA